MALRGPCKQLVRLLVIAQLELTDRYVKKIPGPRVLVVKPLKILPRVESIPRIKLFPCLFVKFIMTFLQAGPVSGQTLRSKEEG